jgi:hypothetical protein
MKFIRHRAALLFLLLFAFGQGARADFNSLLDPKDPLSCMGINIHFVDPKPGELEMISQAGFRWVRMDFTWENTEKTAGVYDFSAYDKLLAALDKVHMHAMLIFCYGNPLYDNGMAPFTDDGRAAYSRWAVAATTHFKNRGVIWEIWNEPNIKFWKPKANSEDYARLALDASKAIHDANPDEVMVGPACAGANMNFVEIVAQKGVLDYWSGITIHPYIRTKPEDYGQDYEKTRVLIKKHGLPENRIDVMCGESGFSSTWTGVDEEMKGKELARFYLFAVLSHVPLMIWYDWHTGENDPMSSNTSFALVGNDYHAGADPVYDHLPAYDAAKTYSQQLAGCRFKQRVKAGSDQDYVLSFTKDDKECMVAWTTSPDSHEVRIPAQDGTYQVTSYDSKKQAAVQTIDGELRLTIDNGPQYIKPQ